MLSPIIEEEAAPPFGNSAVAMPTQQPFLVAVDADSDSEEEVELVSLDTISIDGKQNDILAEQAQVQCRW